jgi:pyruvate,water dikinase
VVRLPRPLELPLPDDAVLVATALLPSQSPLLAQARAVITEQGGVTSHGATLAREYGLPAVLGVGPSPLLVEGASVEVDGDGGRIALLAPRPTAARPEIEPGSARER